MEDDDYEDLLGRYGSTKRNSAGVNESGFNAHESEMGDHDIVEVNSSGQRINTCPDKSAPNSQSRGEISRGGRYVRSALDDY